MNSDKETELTLQGMADCMDMVRQELVEAGVIDERVPPMFVSEALLTKLRQLRAAFHVNMVRAYPAKTHAEIAAEIDRTCWGTALSADDEITALHRQLAAEKLRADLAETRAASKSKECMELRERMAARPAIPSTPEQAIAFIGNQCEVIEYHEQPDRVRFQLTAHDLLSAFDWWFDTASAESVTVTEKGPWTVDHWGQGRIVIQSGDSTFTVALEVYGHFDSDEREIAHAQEIARRLNAYPTLVYTCIGKGGEYELIGQAKGAGTMRDHADLVVYRDAQTGQLYCRARPDFVERMQLVGSQR
jgi:hypothetical protein